MFIGGMFLAPLVASLRLDPRPTAFVGTAAVAIAVAVTVVEPGMNDVEQRVASLAIAAVGSLLAVLLARVRGDREQSSRRLAAQHAVARAGAEAGTVSDVAMRMLQAVARELEWEVGALWEVGPGRDVLRRTAAWHEPGLDVEAFARLSEETCFRRGVGLPGRVWSSGEPAWIVDVREDPNFPRAPAAAAAGLRSAFAFPTGPVEGSFGVMELFTRERRRPDPHLLETMATLGIQVGHYIDVRRAEQAVRDSEAVKSAILDTALDCVITMDGGGNVVDFNHAAEVVFGYRAEEVVGRELAALIIPPGLRERHRAGLRRYLETGEGVVFEGRLELAGMRSDGSEFPVELAVQRIPGSEPALFAGYLRDISDRLVAERALRRSRDELDATLGSLADGVTVQDATGAIVYANRAAASTLGFGTAEEVMAAPLADVTGRFEVFDEDGEPFPLERLPGRRALAGDQPDDVVVRFRVRASGAERWTVVKSTPVRDESGAVIRAVNIFEDITAQKRVEVGQRFLAEASRLLGASLDYTTTLRSVARVAVPTFADWCAVDVLGERGGIEHVAVAHADPRKVEFVEQLRRRYPADPEAPRGVFQVIRSERSELYAEIPEELLAETARDSGHLDLIGSLGMRSAMVVPLRAWRGAVGAMTFVNSESGRVFDEADLVLAEELGRRAATAIENARLYGERAHIARTLQRSLLPPHLPDIPGIEVAARYRAAGEGNEVGGDFYDLFDTGDGRWAVLIGDVCGKGADAAALTALARYTLRAAAMRERRPARVLATLNEALLRQRDDRQFCTVAYASLDAGADGAELVVACGGHPAPIVVREDGAVEVLSCRGTLLGVVADPELDEVAARLGPGDAVVLYTDGLTEARTPDGLLGEERVAAVGASVAGCSATEIARRLEEAASTGAGLRDDLAIVVLRVGGGGDGRAGAAEEHGALSTAVVEREDGAFDLRLPATAEAIRAARQAVDRLGRSLQPELLDDLRLLVSELVTNGLRHGRPGGEDWIGLALRLESGALHVEVSDPGPGFEGGLRERRPDATGGWGLYLVDQLAARWGMSRGERTTVWFELGAEG